MNRPEEPTEWAGLPSEPREPGSPAESLADGAVPDALALVDGGSVASLVVEIDVPDDASAGAPDADAPRR